MALDTYTNLQTTIANWLARPGDTNITTNVADIITVFESEARRKLFTRFNETTATLVTVAGTATVALPADFYELRSIRLSSTPDAKLIYLTPDELDTVLPDKSDRERPRYYTIEGLNLRLAPTPDAVYTLPIGYQQGITALSNSAPTNWLLTNHPDAYLFGSRAEAGAFIGDDDQQVADWIARRDLTFASILEADRKARWGGGALQIKTDTGNP